MGGLTVPELVVALAAFTGALVTGALGYGYSSITVPVALLFIPSRTLAPALVLLELATNCLGLFTHRHQVPAVFRRMVPILAGLLPGVAVGSWVLSSTSGGHIKLATYAVLLPLVIAQTAGLRWPIRREKTAAVPTGMAIGALYSATTISGPPIALFLNNQGLAQTEFRAAVYVIRVAESALTTIVYLALGLFTAPSDTLALHLLPTLVVGLPLGVVLLRRLDPESFRRISMGANAAFISFGLARTVIDHQLAPPVVAYAGMAVVAATEVVLVLRFFARRRTAVPAVAAAPRA